MSDWTLCYLIHREANLEVILILQSDSCENAQIVIFRSTITDEETFLYYFLENLQIMYYMHIDTYQILNLESHTTVFPVAKGLQRNINDVLILQLSYLLSRIFSLEIHEQLLCGYNTHKFKSSSTSYCKTRYEGVK